RIVRQAEYLENSARPAHNPVADHQPQAIRPRLGSAWIRHKAAPSSAQSSGPSGRTHVPVVMPNTGDRLSSTAAQRPARGPATTEPRRAISQVEPANSAMNGRRTTIG